MFSAAPTRKNTNAFAISAITSQNRFTSSATRRLIHRRSNRRSAIPLAIVAKMPEQWK